MVKEQAGVGSRSVAALSWSGAACSPQADKAIAVISNEISRRKAMTPPPWLQFLSILLSSVGFRTDLLKSDLGEDGTILPLAGLWVFEYSCYKVLQVIDIPDKE